MPKEGLNSSTDCRYCGHAIVAGVSGLEYSRRRRPWNIRDRVIRYGYCAGGYLLNLLVRRGGR